LNRPPLSIGSKLDNYPEALSYLNKRGLHDPTLIREFEIGYAPGGSPAPFISRHRVTPSICCGKLGRST